MARDAGYAHDHLAPLGRDRRQHHRRPGGRHLGGPDQDRFGQPQRPRRQVQPAAAHRRRARRVAPVRGTRRHPSARRVGVAAHGARGTHDMLRLVLLRHGESTWNQENRFTGWTDVDLSDKGRQEAREAGRLMARREVRVRRRLHLGAQARHPHALDRARRDGPDVDSRAAFVAPERAALRCAAGAEQGGNRRRARRRAGQDLAPQLRHPAAAADARTTRAIRRTIGATRRSTETELPLTESLKDTVARFLPYWHETIAPDIKRRQARADRRARQQPARAGEVSRQRVGRRDRRTEHPDRRAAGLPAERRAEAAAEVLPGRSGGDRRKRRRGRESGEGEGGQ